MLIIVKECNHGRTKARTSQPNTATFSGVGKGTQCNARRIPAPNLATKRNRAVAETYPVRRVRQVAAQRNPRLAGPELPRQSRVGSDEGIRAEETVNARGLDHVASKTA